MSSYQQLAGAYDELTWDVGRLLKEGRIRITDKTIERV